MNEELLPDPHAAEAGDAAMGLWVACVEQLAQDLPEQQFNTWIKPLTAQVAPDFSKVTLQVANRFKLDWIRAQYAGRIAAILEGLYGQAVAVELVIAQRASVARTYVRPAAVPPPGDNAPAAESAAPAASGDDGASGAFRTRLNPALTFETLV